MSLRHFLIKQMVLIMKNNISYKLIGFQGGVDQFILQNTKTKITICCSLHHVIDGVMTKYLSQSDKNQIERIKSCANI